MCVYSYDRCTNKKDIENIAQALDTSNTRVDAKCADHVDETANERIFDHWLRGYTTQDYRKSYSGIKKHFAKLRFEIAEGENYSRNSLVNMNEGFREYIAHEKGITHFVLLFPRRKEFYDFKVPVYQREWKNKYM